VVRSGSAEHLHHTGQKCKRLAMSS